MINNLGPSGILAAPYVAYSACPNDAESILIEGLSDWIWRKARWGWFHTFTVDGTEQQIQRANRHPTRPTRIRATKQEARPVKLSSGRRGPLCAHVFCQVWFLLIATWPSTSPAKGLWLAGRHPGMMCLLLLLPWTRQASNTVCWHEVPHHGNPAQCCLFTGNCSIILVLSC